MIHMFTYHIIFKSGHNIEVEGTNIRIEDEYISIANIEKLVFYCPKKYIQKILRYITQEIDLETEGIYS